MATTRKIAQPTSEISDELPAREAYEYPATLLTECPMVGWSRFERAHRSLAPHVHTNSYEICFLVSGTVEWWVGNEVFKVAPRDIFVTRPGENHGGLDAFMHPCELYWVHVRPRSGFYQQLSGLQHRLFPGHTSLAGHYQRLLQEARSASRGTADAMVREAARATLKLLVVDVLRCHQRAVVAGSLPLVSSLAVRGAMAWIQGHYADGACLEGAARAAGLAATQFRKRFQEETGYSPHEYQTHVQIQEAKNRLTGTRDPVTQIAFDLGFSSSQYFATAFRRATGLSPQQYREIRKGDG